MNNWLSIAEIQTSKIAGMPASRRGILKKLSRENYATRIRRGKGGGREYLMNDTGAVRQQVSGGVSLPLFTPPVFSKNIDRGVERATIVNIFTDYIEKHNLTLTQGAVMFVEEFNSGKIDGDFIIKQISPASLIRWRNFVEGGYFQKLAGAFGNRKGHGRIDGDEKLQAEIIAHFTNTRLAGKTIKALLVAGGFDNLPSARQIANWFNTWAAVNPSEALALRNPDKARSKFSLAFGTMYGHLTQPNELWEIDASPADVLCDDGRYNIYAIQDVFTRRLIIEVSKTPSTVSSLRLIRRAIAEWGMPAKLRTDNGSDFTSKWFKNAMWRAGINHDITNPYSPQEKAAIERAIGTINHQFMPLQPGYAGHNVAAREEMRSRESFAFKMERARGNQGKKEINLRITAEQLQKRADHWAQDIYANNRHSGIECTPLERYARFAGRIRKLENIDMLNYLFAPIAGGDGLRTITKKGIRVDGHQYIAPEIALYVGRNVLVCMDAADMGKIYVSDADSGEFLFKALNPELEGIDPIAVKAQAKQLASERRDEILRDAKRAGTRIRSSDMYAALHRAKYGQGYQQNKKLHVLDRRETPITANDLDVPAETQKIAELPNIDKSNYRKAKNMEQLIAANEFVSAGDKEWLARFQKSDAYQSFEMMADDFGKGIWASNDG